MPPPSRPPAAPAARSPPRRSTSPQLACRELRLRQIQAEVSTAAALFHYEHGTFPPDLGELVDGGQLDPTTGRAVEQLGWRYALEANGQGYRMAM